MPGTAWLRLLPRFRDAYRFLPVLEDRERWSRPQIEALQLERINDVWATARARVPHYRDLNERLRLPERFASLAEFTALVPELDRETARAAPDRLLADAAEPGRWTVTSGSTGEPFRAFTGQEAALHSLRTKYRFLAAWGIDIFDRSAFLWGRAGQIDHGLTGWWNRVRQAAEDWFRNRLRLSAYHLTPADLRRHLRRLAAFRPTFLYSYSTAAMLLAREALLADFRCPSLRLAVLTSEPVTVAARQAVEQGLGVPVAAEYGSIECGYIAGEQPDRTMRVREDRVYLEALPGPGGLYRLVVTVLDNPSFPLLRYQIGDLTSAPLQVPDSGFAILKDVAGRHNDLLMGRTGRLIHPFLLDVLFEGLSGVRRWQAHQARCGSLSVAVERDGPDVTFDTVELQRQVSELVDGQRVEVHLTDALHSKNGKHRWVVSELTAEHSSAPLPATS